MALDLKKLRSRLASAQKKGGEGGQWWKPEKGDQTVRIVPTKDGDPFKDYWFHYNVGKNPGFLCPKKNYNEDCPVCDFATKLWREGTEDSTNMAKKLFARQRFFTPVMVRGQEDKKVRAWGFGKTVYETLIKLCLNPEYGDITDLETGTDLDLNYETPPGANFPKTTLQPKRKSSKLCKDLSKEECEALLDSVPDFVSLMDSKTHDDIEGMLNEWLASDDSAEGSETTRSYGSNDEAKEENPIDAKFNDLLDKDE